MRHGPRQGAAAGLAVLLLIALPVFAQTPADQRRSGFDFMSPETQAMQKDDLSNPGMFSLRDGEALWTERSGTAKRACADCHGDAKASMRGVAARHPAYDPQERRPINLEQRINQCRTARQGASPFPYESPALIGLSTYVGHQSRGVAVAPSADERLASFRENGRALYEM